MPLETLNNTKVALLVSGSGDDTLLTQLLAAAESFVQEQTGRNFAGGSFTEYHAAGGGSIFLKNWPVSSITSLRVDPAREFGASTERDATTYVVHETRGVVESVVGPFLPPYRKGSRDWPEAVKVVYATATDSVPAAVKQAVADLVGHWYRQAKTSADAGFLMLTENTSGTDTKGYSWSLTRGLSIPPGILETLAPFRVPCL